MNTGDLKNIVVIKDLPSNLIEEAIVVLKENQKIPKLEPASKDKKENSSETPKIKNSKDYIIKEAQMLIADYISNIENPNTNKSDKLKANRKYIRLKNYAYISSVIMFIQFIMLIIK